MNRYRVKQSGKNTYEIWYRTPCGMAMLIVTADNSGEEPVFQWVGRATFNVMQKAMTALEVFLAQKLAQVLIILD